MENVLCQLGHVSLRKYSVFVLLYLLHSSDQEELFLTAKKIGKDLSVILKHETFQRSIISLENVHHKDVLKDITSS